MEEKVSECARARETDRPQAVVAESHSVCLPFWPEQPQKVAGRRRLAPAPARVSTAHTIEAAART
jgi:hypothetical protein